MEPGVEKKRKRRRSLRAYANLNKPIIPETEELINQFPPYAPDDDDAVSEAAEPKPRARRTAKPEVEKRDYSAAERRKLASEGKALPSGAYPIVDQEDLENAAHLARTATGT